MWMNEGSMWDGYITGDSFFGICYPDKKFSIQTNKVKVIKGETNTDTIVPKDVTGPLKAVHEWVCGLIPNLVTHSANEVSGC